MNARAGLPTFTCVYCGAGLRDDHSPCCGEVGHVTAHPFCECCLSHGQEERDFNLCDKCGKPLWEYEPEETFAPGWNDYDDLEAGSWYDDDDADAPV